jgi:hypothetical protein
MQTTVVTIPTERITNWDSFHDTFAAMLGFPAFYGRNMNAWIDCMGYIDDAESGMTSVAISAGTILTLRLDRAQDFERRCPEQYRELIEGTAAVNQRRLETGDEPILALMLAG